MSRDLNNVQFRNTDRGVFFFEIPVSRVAILSVSPYNHTYAINLYFAVEKN